MTFLDPAFLLLGQFPEYISQMPTQLHKVFLRHFGIKTTAGDVGEHAPADCSVCAGGAIAYRLQLPRARRGWRVQILHSCRTLASPVRDPHHSLTVARHAARPDQRSDRQRPCTASQP
jgi:hypothetical protein